MSRITEQTLKEQKMRLFRVVARLLGKLPKQTARQLTGAWYELFK